VGRETVRLNSAGGMEWRPHRSQPQSSPRFSSNRNSHAGSGTYFPARLFFASWPPAVRLYEGSHTRSVVIGTDLIPNTLGAPVVPGSRQERFP